MVAANAHHVGCDEDLFPLIVARIIAPYLRAPVQFAVQAFLIARTLHRPQAHRQILEGRLDLDHLEVRARRADVQMIVEPGDRVRKAVVPVGEAVGADAAKVRQAQSALLGRIERAPPRDDQLLRHGRALAGEVPGATARRRGRRKGGHRIAYSTGSLCGFSADISAWVSNLCSPSSASSTLRNKSMR